MKPFARWNASLFVAALLALILACSIWFGRASEIDFRKRIAEAERTRQWQKAETLWDTFVHRYPGSVTPDDLVREARCALMLDKPAKARRSLDAWLRTEREGTEGWQLSIEIRRALGDSDGVNEIMREMLRSDEARRSLALLSAATFGILTAMNAEESRERLQRWAKAEPDSPLAEAWALARRIEDSDLAGPIGAESLEEVSALAQKWPNDPDVWRVYVESLFLQGDYEEVKRASNQWPAEARNSIAWARLEGRRALEVENDPERAIPHFRSVLERVPQDWRTHYRLARALAGAGRHEEAQAQARRTVEIRELMDPISLEKVLDATFTKGKPPGPTKLIELLRRIGQTELAQAWLEWYDAERLISKVR
ncbi:tetratricopeptide repeat protein [bacterium]|nr:tetratricopeptide repeat protein [bacterium]